MREGRRSDLPLSETQKREGVRKRALSEKAQRNIINDSGWPSKKPLSPFSEELQCEKLLPKWLWRAHHDYEEEEMSWREAIESNPLILLTLERSWNKKCWRRRREEKHLWKAVSTSVTEKSSWWRRLLRNIRETLLCRGLLCPWLEEKWLCVSVAYSEAMADLSLLCLLMLGEVILLC